MFIPLDRWGSAPVDLRALSRRAAPAIAAAHLAGMTPEHADPRPAAISMDELLGGRATTTPGTDEHTTPPPLLAPNAGTDARRHALAALDDVDDALAQVGREADAISRRIEELLGLYA